jgi:hypothetical protein
MASLHQWSVNVLSAPLPPFWTIGGAAINEQLLKLRVFELAAGLKADIMLDLIEGNEVWPSITSLIGSLRLLDARKWVELRKVIKTASGGFLAWKFGVKPILQDIMAVQRSLPTLKQAINSHIKRKPHRYSAKAEQVASISLSPYGSYYSIGGVNCLSDTWQGLVQDAPTVRYVLVVKPRASYTQDFFAKLDFALSRFATSPASLAWELVPYSFVVDWFVDIRGALLALDRVVNSVPYEIVAYTRSYSYTLSTQSFLDISSPCGGAVASLKGSYEYKLYERSDASFPGILPFMKPHFGKSQAAISAALISQFLANKR